MCWEEKTPFIAVETEVDRALDETNFLRFGATICNRLPLVTAYTDSYEYMLEHIEKSDPYVLRNMLMDAAGASTRREWAKMFSEQGVNVGY